MGSWRPMTVTWMSRSEIDRMNVLRDLAEDRIRVSEAATLMGLGRRQVFRLAKAFRQRGPAALASRGAGNRATDAIRGVCGRGWLASSASAMRTSGRRLPARR